jgi:hypothetical protein
VEGWLLKPAAAAQWLNQLPLAGTSTDLADELRWWSHLQRWSLSLLARGRWLPEARHGRGRWQPLLNREDDRRRLEDLASRLPQVVDAGERSTSLSCRRPGSQRLLVARLLEVLLDGQLRSGFSPNCPGLDPLLGAWQKALGPGDGRLELDGEDAERLETATHHWREAVAGRVEPAHACLELSRNGGEELWELRFSLQAEADPSMKLGAATVWAAGDTPGPGGSDPGPSWRPAAGGPGPGPAGV